MSVYGRRFAFVAGLLAGQSGPAVLTGPLARARFWVLRPTWIRLTDNTVRFGYKEELRLDEPDDRPAVDAGGFRHIIEVDPPMPSSPQSDGAERLAQTLIL